MKLFFELSPPSPERAALRREEEAFIAALAAADPARVVFSAGQADVVVIHAATEQYHSASFASLLRPLSRGDVERLVWDWGDFPTGRSSGFYCSLDRRLFDPRRHRTTCYPIAFNEMVSEFPHGDAVHDYGFIGGLTAGVRQRLFATLDPQRTGDNAFLKLQGADWSSAFVRQETDRKREYADFLRRTRFVLCPRGQGAGSARLFETMKAGRVPVIVSDGYVPPAGVDWASCSLRVGEHDLDSIPAVVAAHLADWPAMARAARKAWEDHFSESGIVASLCDGVEALRRTAPRVGSGYRLIYGARMAGVAAAAQARPAIGKARHALAKRLGRANG